MKHFLTFQKKKGLFLSEGSGRNSNENLAYMINHELMNTGYVLSKELFEVLASQNQAVLREIYNDLIKGIKEVTGGDGYEPIYRNFPQSVLNMDYDQFIRSAIVHYWSGGNWRPSDLGYLNREFAVEPTDYKTLRLLTEREYFSIFYDVVYSGTSISAFDKKIVDYFIENEDVNVELAKISFKETSAYVGVRLLEKGVKLPTGNATDVLRLWASYSDGDEGLKENTKFKNPSSKEARVLRETLDGCYNLEDSFKSYREPWLRVLFYLNPMTNKNRSKYPNLYAYTVALRNSPETLETFNAKVERMIKDRDSSIFRLLRNRAGVFTRRLDHLVREFGREAIDAYLGLENITFLNLATAYNHFTDRDKEQAGRGAILASQSKSEVVTYDALAPLDSGLVEYIKEGLLNKMTSNEYSIYPYDRHDDEGQTVFIDRSLFYTPLQMNNRASSLSLDSKVKGQSEIYDGGKTLRLYAHWEGKDDIDLSGFVIRNDSSIEKVGWNGSHKSNNFIVYSGDNTGYAAKNAEYLDINTKVVPSDVEWIITEARIYRGKNKYSDYNGRVKMGWMGVERPQANNHWQPKQLEHAMTVDSSSRTAYLMAYHAPTKSVVYLDMAMGDAIVSNAEDAIKMRTFLETFITLDDGGEISWDKLNQGHLLSMRMPNQVSDSREADVVFDENTTADEIARILNS